TVRRSVALTGVGELLKSAGVMREILEQDERLLLSGDESLQVASVQCVSSVLVHSPSQYCAPFIQADIPGIESLVRSLKAALKLSNLEVQKQGLRLLTTILERQPKGVRLFPTSPGFVGVAEVVVGGVASSCFQVATQATRAAAALLRLAEECVTEVNVRENVFKAPDKQNEDMMQSFCVHLLQCCDTVYIPTVTRVCERGPCPQVLQLLFSILSLQFSLCPALMPDFANKLGVEEVEYVLRECLPSLCCRVCEWPLMLSEARTVSQNTQYCLLHLLYLSLVHGDRLLPDATVFSSVVHFMFVMQEQCDSLPPSVLQSALYLLTATQDSSPDLDWTPLNSIIKTLSSSPFSFSLLSSPHPSLLRFIFRYPELAERFGARVLAGWLAGGSEPSLIRKEGCSHSDPEQNSVLLELLERNPPIAQTLLVRSVLLSLSLYHCTNPAALSMLLCNTGVMEVLESLLNVSQSSSLTPLSPPPPLLSCSLLLFSSVITLQHTHSTEVMLDVDFSSPVVCVSECGGLQRPLLPVDGSLYPLGYSGTVCLLSALQNLLLQHVVCQPWNLFLLYSLLNSGESLLLHPATLSLLTLLVRWSRGYIQWESDVACVCEAAERRGVKELGENTRHILKLLVTEGLLPKCVSDKRLFETKRKDQLNALKNLVELNDVNQQYKIIDIMLKGLFKVLEDSRAVLIAANMQPDDPFPLDDKIKEAYSHVVENTAFFGDVALRFPRIVHHYYDRNTEWGGLLRWGLRFCNQTGVFSGGAHQHVLTLMSQELGITEKSPDFTNPYRTERDDVLHTAEAFQKLLREEQKRRRKEEKRKEMRKGPRISRSRTEL
ncbi:hypothetical protein P4O66_019060, partial [Electrophorus voltai]